MTERIRDGVVFRTCQDFKNCLESYCKSTGYVFVSIHASFVESYNASKLMKDKPDCQLLVKLEVVPRGQAQKQRRRLSLNQNATINHTKWLKMLLPSSWIAPVLNGSLKIDDSMLINNNISDDIRLCQEDQLVEFVTPSGWTCFRSILDLKRCTSNSIV